MKYKIVSPAGILKEGEAVSLSIPAAVGELTILEHHADLVSVIIPGAVRAVASDGTEEDLVVASGILEVQHGEVRLLVDEAERVESLDASAIEAAITRARQVMREAVRSDDASFAAAAASLERELARARVVRRRHAPKTPMMDRGSK